MEKLFVIVLLFFVVSAVAARCFRQEIICREKHCYEACGKHVKPDHCRRGCRIHHLLELTHKGEGDKKTLQICHTSCSEAYPSAPDNGKACVHGCDSFASETSPCKNMKPQEEEKTHIHFMQPLMIIRRIYSKFGGNNLVSFSSWSVYQRDKDGKIMVFGRTESAPENVDASPLLQTGGHARDGVTLELTSSTRNRRWWCVVERGLQPMLALMLLLSALSLVWMCCSTPATAPSVHVTGEEKSKKSEKEALLSMPLEMDQAGELPVKIPIEQI